MQRERIITWKLSVDGASRNNPGPAGAGICLKRDNTFVERQGFFLGKKTNNEAEYLALLVGIVYAKRHMDAHDFLLIVSDSQLLIRQLQGAYKVRDAKLIPLYHAAMAELQGLQYGVEHVLRECNVDADEMANLGIDKKRALPSEVIARLLNYDIRM
jgi:ribonuclease HI